MYAPFLTKLHENLDKEVSRVQEFMGSGGCSSHEEYQKKVGEIEGLEIAQQLIISLLESLDEEDI